MMVKLLYYCVEGGRITIETDGAYVRGALTLNQSETDNQNIQI